MPYDRFGHTPETVKRERSIGFISLFLVIVVAIWIVLLLFVASPSPALTKSANELTYDYAGPDGTLTGVPYQLRNYVVIDHDTGVYYFLIQDPETGNLALCPRLESDGTPWQKPTYTTGGE